MFKRMILPLFIAKVENNPFDNTFIVFKPRVWENVGWSSSIYKEQTFTNFNRLHPYRFVFQILLI